MSCTCDTWPTAFWEYRPISRKQHTCCECGSVIDVGEKYYKVKGVWDGKFMTFNTCEICEMIRIKAISELDRCIPFRCLYDVVGSDFEEKIKE